LAAILFQPVKNRSGSDVSAAAGSALGAPKRMLICDITFEPVAADARNRRPPKEEGRQSSRKVAEALLSSASGVIFIYRKDFINHYRPTVRCPVKALRN
jgi:hypothetical protein